MKPKGIFHLTGEPDSGKTTCALGAYPLNKTAYLYDDIKKFQIEELNASQLKNEFGLFADLTEKYSITKFKLLEYYHAIKLEIDAIPDNKFDSIVFDTWSRTGKAIKFYAKHNPLEFREAKTFSKKGDIRGKEEWAEAAKVETAMISRLSNKCKALFLITHTKPIYKANVATEAHEPDCSKSFRTICNARLWFRHNPDSGVPIALVLKRMAKIELIDGRINPINLLPRKITPLQTEKSVWDAIDRYWENPVGNREPTEDEIPNDFELGILGGVLTDSQKQMWQIELKVKQEEEQKEEVFFNDQMQEIKKEAIASGLPAPLAFNQLVAKYPALTLNQVQEWLGS